METLVELAPWLVAMSALMLASGFFSASEAALFFLSPHDKRGLAKGNRAQRLAAGLLDQPERLLTAVLFWNLVINITYFAIAAVASIHLEEGRSATFAWAFGLGSLLVIILFSEMLPKVLAVSQSRLVASLFAVPLAAAVRTVDPLIPVFRTAIVLSRRLVWPRFAPEPYLEVNDLERAVELSTTDAALLEQERAVLANIVSLSEIRADELMRPRMQFQSFRPPVALADLEGRVPPSGYVLVTEADSEEIAAAIPLKTLSHVPAEHLEHYAEEVFYLPWCATAGEALEQMRRRDRNVVAVVNEFGETIGILTIDDILDTVFTHGGSRSERLLNQQPIQPAGDGVWRVLGMATRRRLAREFRVPLPPSKSVTVSGIVQEMLGRLPEPGDRGTWGPFEIEVLEVPQQGQLIVALRIAERREQKR